MQSEAERIAAGLTKAQRVALLTWSPPQPPHLLDWLVRNITNEDMDGIRSLELATKPNLRRGVKSKLTPLGLQVRHILERNGHAD